MYKVVIGLEVHCELKTKSKNFSAAKNSFSTVANENVLPGDLALPGTLPVVNKEAVHKALKTALALDCITPNELLFDRKNYFYPDLAKGYQITQLTKPMGINGHLNVYVNEEIKKIDIHQIHLEEDTASMEHFPNFSLINYNRSGIPLIEIVTEPCIYSADEAVAFLETLRNLIIYCGVSDADSKKGQMRCDVNISLMKETDLELGTKIEMKNINKFSAVRSSIEYEIKRQTKILETGGEIKQETRRYSEEDDKTYSMREKVDAVDYKYFIDPNLPPIHITKEYINQIKKEIPMLQNERIEKYITEYELSEYDAKVLSRHREISDYYNEVIEYGVDPKLAANWVTTVVLGSLNKLNMELKDFFITSKMLSDIVKLVNEKKLSQNHAKKILHQSMSEKIDPLTIIKEQNLQQIDDVGQLKEVVNEVINENNDALMQFFEGKNFVINFLVGKVMAKTNRQANPETSLKLITEELEKRRQEYETK